MVTARPSEGSVVVLGEVLVEMSSTQPLTAGQHVRLGFSGDVLNSAAASAAAGARTVLVARVPDDELGDALVDHAGSLGVDCSAIRRVPGQHGVYFTHADPSGGRQFTYARSGSAGSQLAPDDLDHDALRSADVVLASGTTCAVSDTAAAAVQRAAQLARCFVYDPNFRPRLTTAETAGHVLRGVLPHAWLITPSWPEEVTALLALGADATAEECLDALRQAGSRRTALTCGADGVVLDDEGEVTTVPAAPAPRTIDQTGAGDSFVGTVAGRVAVGDPLADAVRLGAAAASLSVQGQGGTGYVASLEEVRAHAGRGSSSTAAAVAR